LVFWLLWKNFIQNLVFWTFLSFLRSLTCSLKAWIQSFTLQRPFTWNVALSDFSFKGFKLIHKTFIWTRCVKALKVNDLFACMFAYPRLKTYLRAFLDFVLGILTMNLFNLLPMYIYIFLCQNIIYCFDQLLQSCHIFCLIYYINVKSPNLDLKLGIKPKAGNFLSGKREGEGGRETEIGR
jgi:hypothetical protein